jgi:hypothetical protein
LLLNVDFDADADPAFDCDVDPDPALRSGGLPKLNMDLDPDPQHIIHYRKVLHAGYVLIERQKDKIVNKKRSLVVAAAYQ